MGENGDLLLPTNDYIFCRLFGSQDHKNILISLLNSILNGNPFIKDVNIDPTEYKKTYRSGKTIRLDIKATTDNGTIINVEMQCVNIHDEIIPRAIFYQSVILTDHSIKSGVEYAKIPNSIAIWLVNDTVTDRYGYMQEMITMFKANYSDPNEENIIDPIEVATDIQRVFIIELKKINEKQRQYISEDLKKMDKNYKRSK